MSTVPFLPKFISKQFFFKSVKKYGNLVYHPKQTFSKHFLLLRIGPAVLDLSFFMIPAANQRRKKEKVLRQSETEWII